MYILTKEFSFEASHQLVGHDGKCARLHGHSWKLWVEVAGDELVTVGPKAGMLVDYGMLKSVVEPIIEACLDHWHLNDTLQTNRPTSEFIARWAFDHIKPALPQICAVTVSETCTTACRYEEPKYLWMLRNNNPK